MRRRLSKGIRIYIHGGSGRARMYAFNHAQGMRELESFLNAPTRPWGVTGTGTESGAMVVHLRWKA